MTGSSEVDLKSTVIVVGAGASVDAGFPAGSKLIRDIAGTAGFPVTRPASGEPYDELLVRAIDSSIREECAGGNGNYTQRRIDLHSAAVYVRDNMPLSKSIDSFLDKSTAGEDVRLIGKLSIANQISKSERASKLYVRVHSDFAKKLRSSQTLPSIWYVEFFKILADKFGSPEALREALRSILMIVFNYDRCVEFFMLNAIQTSFQIDAEEAGDILSELEIIHPYGSLGALPDIGSSNDYQLGFGEEVNASDLRAIADRIRVYTEDVTTNVRVGTIIETARKAKTIIFLGFGFHHQNMNLLSAPKVPKGDPFRPTRILATATGFEAPDVRDITETLNRRFGTPEVNVFVDAEVDCSTVFRKYSRLLSDAIGFRL